LSPIDWHSMWVGWCHHSLNYLESHPLHQLTCAPCGGEVDAHLCAHGTAFLCMSSPDACKCLIDLFVWLLAFIIWMQYWLHIVAQRWLHSG
jgi:hypothetical protein